MLFSSLSNTVASKSPAYLELKIKYEVAREKVSLRLTENRKNHVILYKKYDKRKSGT